MAPPLPAGSPSLLSLNASMPRPSRREGWDVSCPPAILLLWPKERVAHISPHPHFGHPISTTASPSEMWATLPKAGVQAQPERPNCVPQPTHES